MVTTAEGQLWRYWAKPGVEGSYHAVPAHLLDVAAVGIAYLRGRPALAEHWARALSLRPSELETLLGWGLAIHDVGKFCDRFQGVVPSLFHQLHPGSTIHPYAPHHTTLGSILLRHVLGKDLSAKHANDHPWSRRDWAFFMEMLEPPFTGHHGQPPQTIPHQQDTWDPTGIDAARAWLDALDDLFSLRNLWRDGARPRDVRDALRAASWHLAGFAVLCDWIGSDERVFTPRHEPCSLTSYLENSIRLAEPAVRAAGILPAEIAPVRSMQGAFQRDPTPLQAHLEGWRPTGPQLLIIEDLTGSGKTEASLLAAHRIMAASEAEGLYFALPTQATANAMLSRLKEAAPLFYARPGEASLVLAHSGRLAMREFRDTAKAWALAGPGERDEGRLECAAWLADSRKKAFLAHIGVGTIDQALLGVLPVRHQSLRLFGLTSRVLIIDEVHAYDAYATSLLDRLLRFHASAGGSAILLSATMPIALRKRLARAYVEGATGEEEREVTLRETSYPLLTLIDEAGGVSEKPIEARAEGAREIHVNFLTSDEEAAKLVQDAASAGKNVCWIRNTVSEAIATRERFGSDATLFHARFVEADRRKIEQQLLGWAGPKSTNAQRKGKILIATQVVEQSLDVDFDAMVSDLAPMELVIQRSGRLHRHHRPDRPGIGPPTLHIRAPEAMEDPREDWVKAWSPGTSAVYPDHGRLWLTDRELRTRGAIRVPQDSRDLVESIYGEKSAATIPAGLRWASDRAESEGLALRGQGHTKALSLAEGYASSAERWLEPDRARTRAGAPSVDLYLALEGPDGPVPLISGEGWEGSRVSVRLGVAEAAGLLKSSTPTVFPPNVIIMYPEGIGSWTARRADHRVVYSTELGLRITEEVAS